MALPVAQTHLAQLSKKEGAIALYNPNKHAATSGGALHAVINSGVRVGSTVFSYALIGTATLAGVALYQNSKLKATLARRRKRRAPAKATSVAARKRVTKKSGAKKGYSLAKAKAKK